MPYSAYDCRFARPNPITRSGLNVYVRLEYYMSWTAAVVELGAYNSAGTRISNPIVTQHPQSLVWWSDSAIWMGTYWKYKYYTATFTFLNATVAAQAVTLRAWLYANTIIIDQTPP